MRSGERITQLREVNLHRPSASGSPRNVHERHRRCIEIRQNTRARQHDSANSPSRESAVVGVGRETYAVYSDVMRYATRRRDETIPRHPIPPVGHEPPERTTSAAEEDAEAADYSREPLIVPRPRPPRASPRPMPARLRRRSPFVFVRDELERRPSHPPHPPPPRGAPPAREPPPPPPPTPPPPPRGPPHVSRRRRRRRADGSPPRPRPYPRSWTPPPRASRAFLNPRDAARRIRANDSCV